MPAENDIFTRTVHGIRLRYAAVGVAFLVLVVGLFHMGGPMTFGWYDFVAVFVLILMVVTLFLLECHCVLGPIERLTGSINGLLDHKPDDTEPLRIPWSGRDEFACLASALNGLLEKTQSGTVALLEENLRLKDIVASFDIELVVMNRQGTVLNVIHRPDGIHPVPGLARGFEPDAATWGEENRQALRKAIAESFEKGGVQVADLSFGTGGAGGVRRIRASLSRPHDGIFLLVSFRELLPPAKENQTVERKVPIARIAAGIANDLKNVFAVVRNASAQLGVAEDPQVRDTTATIYRAVRSGTSMMDELMTLGGDIRLRLKRLGAVELIEGARPLIRGIVEGTGVRVNYDLSADSPSVTVDPNQINKVLVTLVRNSVEAFGIVPGTIDISVRAHELTAEEGLLYNPPLAPGTGVLIDVSDNGPGIPAQLRQRIFEPYCTTRSKGRGLGLAIACSIVEAHGGGMRAATARESGTDMKIFLRTADRPREEVDLVRKAFPGGEVLVVDDSPLVLRITSALLRSQQIAAHTADCPADALRKFSELSDRLRAVMLDAQIGDTKSVALLEDMRAINPDIPVIVVSGYSKDEIDKIFAAHPPDAYLMKPYTVAELQQVLKQ